MDFGMQYKSCLNLTFVSRYDFIIIDSSINIIVCRSLDYFMTYTATVYTFIYYS